MNIIAFDSADQVLSAALASETGVWYTEISPVADAALKRHSELLLECAEYLCRSAEIRQNELNLVVCMKGPGSFTGLRIGFSAAKGIALALGIPLAAVPTLDCLAYPLSIWPGLVIPAMDAKKNCFFTAFYREGKRLSDYMDAPAETIAKEAGKYRFSPADTTDSPHSGLIVLTGGGAAKLYTRLSAFIPAESIKVDPEYGRGRARELLEIGKDVKINNTSDTNAGPFYLRKSDAELKFT